MILKIKIKVLKILSLKYELDSNLEKI